MSADAWTNFSLTDDQEMIRDTARKFAEDVLLPQAIEIDQQARFPQETFEQMAELGFLGLPLSEDVDGAGLGYFAYGLVLEELAKHCGSTALGLEAHISLCAHLIDRYGNEEQRKTFVPDLAMGAKLGAFALTEPHGGSDAGSARTTAQRDGEHYVLNGRKSFITNANVAGTFVVTARTHPDESLGAKGISAFIVDRDTEGLIVEKGEEKLGMRGSDWGNLVFENARVPVAQRIGEESEGFRFFMETLDTGRIAIGALALGLAEGAFARTVQYSKERVAFGKPLAQQQAVAFKLAEMATRIEAARHLVYHGLRLVEQGSTQFRRQAAIAKNFAAQTASFVADEAIQIHGGYGYVNEYHVERIYRDAKLCEIGEGTNEICNLVIGREVLR